MRRESSAAREAQQQDRTSSERGLAARKARGAAAKEKQRKRSSEREAAREMQQEKHRERFRSGFWFLVFRSGFWFSVFWFSVGHTFFSVGFLVLGFLVLGWTFFRSGFWFSVFWFSVGHLVSGRVFGSKRGKCPARDMARGTATRGAAAKNARYKLLNDILQFVEAQR